MSESIGPDVLARAIAQSPLSTVLYDAEGYLLAANEAFERLWGVRLDTAPARYNVLTDPQLVRQGMADIIRRAFEGEAVVTPPVRYDIAQVSATGEGRVLWTEGHFFPVRDHSGRLTHVMLVHVDLTTRMQMQEALHDRTRQYERERDRLRQLQDLTAKLAQGLTADEVADVILTAGLAALGGCSGAVCLLTDSRTELEIIRQRGLAADTEVEFRRFPLAAPFPLSHAVRSGEPVFLENKAAVVAQYPALAQANARAMTEAWVALPLVLDADTMGGLAFGFAHERTFSPEDRAFTVAIARQCAQALERARLYDAEQRAREAAEEANRAKSEFLTTMSHELRTPLNAIDGYAELLELGVQGPLTPEQRAYVARIRRSQKHLLGLVNDVLSFARLESGRVDLTIEPLVVDEVVQSIEEIVMPMVHAKGLRFECRRAGTGARVLADVDMLQQTMLNLITNAVKFTETGSVTVATELRDHTVVISVSDTGRGIPSNMLEAIFEPFVQVEPTLTRTSTGTGLGLAISRDQARRMGGDVFVRSVPGEGSVFSVELPRAM